MADYWTILPGYDHLFNPETAEVRCFYKRRYMLAEDHYMNSKYAGSDFLHAKCPCGKKWCTFYIWGGEKMEMDKDGKLTITDRTPGKINPQGKRSILNSCGAHFYITNGRTVDIGDTETRTVF